MRSVRLIAATPSVAFSASTGAYSCASCCSCLATADFGSLMTTGVPRLSDSGISRLDGIEQEIFMPIGLLGVGRVEPDLGVGPVEDELPLRLDTDVVEGVERLAQAADAGHVEARHQQQVGGALDGGQRALVEARRRVDDDVVEVLRQQRQHRRRRGRGRSSRRRPDRWRRPGRTARASYGVRNSLTVVASIWLVRASCASVCSGGQRQRRPEVAELDVEVDGDHPARMALGEGDREVGGDGGLAGAALRRDHDDDLGLAWLAAVKPLALTTTPIPCEGGGHVGGQLGGHVVPDDHGRHVVGLHHFTTV